MEWAVCHLHTEVGDPPGKRLDGFRAVLKQLQRDGGGDQRRHGADATV
ncbi:MAG: hypothetical protein ACK56I_22630 [bacterium]